METGTGALGGTVTEEGLKMGEVMICSEKSKNSGVLGLIEWGRAELSRAGIDETREECERILMKLFGCSRSGIYLEEHELTASGVREQFLAIIEKRIQRVPLAYLLKEADFWQETLYVDERCLIPRPETEILVEQVLKALGKDDEKRFSFLDIGTGSGAIAIAILRAFKNARGTLLDVSGEALEVARVNLKKYRLNQPVIARSPANGGATWQSVSKARLLPLHLAVARQQQGRNDNDNESRARLVQGDLFGPFSSNEKWDLIVSNPPYLSEKDWKEVQEELKFEPRKALDGGKDGLDFYRRIIEGAQSHLTSDGLLALEVGGQAGPPIPTGTAQSAVVRHAVKSRTSSSAERARFNKNRALRGLDAPSSQAETVSKWLHDAGYDNIQRFNDHLQVQRVLTARRHS